MKQLRLRDRMSLVLGHALSIWQKFDLGHLCLTPRLNYSLDYSSSQTVVHRTLGDSLRSFQRGVHEVKIFFIIMNSSFVFC